MTLQEKALRTIEGMILSYCPVLDTEEHKLLNQIYAYAHVAVGECDNKHRDWVKELNADYRKLKKHGVI